jgi:hypothetical protein
MRKLLALFLAAAATACGKPPELTRETARAAIEASEAFRAPLEAGIVFTDTTFQPSKNARREILEIQALTVKDDGPMGGAGQTATLTFTYRWTEGPLAGHTLRSKARLHSSGSAWKAYDDYLKKELFRTERGED